MEFVENVPPSNHSHASSSRSQEIDAEVKTLQENPGRWALIKTGVPASYNTPYKRRGCHVRLRTTKGFENTQPIDRRFDLYVMWPLSKPTSKTSRKPK